MSLGILLDFQTLTFQLPRGNHSRFRAHAKNVIMKTKAYPNLHYLGCGCDDVPSPG